MSIIYSALKKTQDNRTPPNMENNKPRAVVFKPKMTLLLLAFASTLAIMIFLHYFNTPSLKLNGIFLSSQENAAMINQHMWHVGDKIGKFQIVSILDNGVTLQNGSKTLLLTPSKNA